MMLVRYLEWRIAAQRFGARPWALGGAERLQVEQQAAREAAVIERALAAPEAGATTADPDVVRSAAEALAGECERAAFLAELARGGMDWEGLCAAIAGELRAGGVLEAVGARAVVSEARVRAWWEARRARMLLPERRTARHILITINEECAENTRARACARRDAVAGALAAGQDFSALALRHSECPSALDGGNLGQVRRGQLYPELDQALFAMAPGEVRAVESALGIHLLRCDAVHPAEPLGYEQAAPSIRRKLEAQERERLQREWLARQDA